MTVASFSPHSLQSMTGDTAMWQLRSSGDHPLNENRTDFLSSVEFNIRVHAVAEALIHTCEPIERYTTPEERRSFRFMTALEGEVKECTGCGFWHTTSGLNEGFICDECVEL